MSLLKVTGLGIQTNLPAYLGDTANTKSTAGLTLNQGASDDEILTLKSSDLNHGITGSTEADSYGTAKKQDAAAGGLRIDGYSLGATNLALVLGGNSDGAADTNKSTTMTAPIVLSATVRSGTGVTTVGANGNLVAIYNNGTARFAFDADGDSHQDVGTAWTNF